MRYPHPPMRPSTLLQRLASSLAFGLALLAPTTAHMAAPAAMAAPLAPAKATAPNAIGGFPGEITKTTLAETTIAAPGFWSTTSGTVRDVIAWTGTDAAHHLNVMTSGTGVIYGNKKTLPETSFAGPAVARTGDGKVVVAWAGTDAAHSLNIEYDVYGARPTKRTLTDTSFTAPAVDLLDGQVVLAWAGTDSNHTLNTFTFSTPDLAPIRKTTLPAQFNTNAPPGLRFDPLGAALGRDRLILSWSARDNGLRDATSNDAASWSAPGVIPESSFAGASVIGIPQSFSTFMPGHYLGWTGTNAARSVNFQFTDNFFTSPAWPNPAATKATLNEAAFGASLLGFIGGPKQVLVAWAGTDAAHHLNVAVVAPSSTCSGIPGFSPLSGDISVITHGNTSRRQVALTFDGGGDFGLQAPQTSQILDTLQDRNVASTWFIGGEWAQQFPDLTRRVHNLGIEMGNHSVDHPHFPASPPVSNDFICYELTLTDQIVADVTGGQRTVPFFRPPFGELGPVFTFNPITSQVSNVAASVGFRTVTWTVDPRDWETTITTQQILDRVLNSPNLGNGAIILLHAGGLHTGDAIGPLISGLQAKGFALVSLSQLLAP